LWVRAGATALYARRLDGSEALAAGRFRELERSHHQRAKEALRLLTRVDDVREVDDPDDLVLARNNRRR
jgi:hypothetical protein